MEIEAWKIGDSDPAPKFNVVEAPNDWARAESDSSLTDNAKLCLKFWTEFAKYAADQKEFAAELKVLKPLPQNWTDFSIGRSGVWLTASVSSYYKTLRVGACVAPGFEFREKVLQSVPALSKSLGAEVECGSGDQLKVLKVSLPFDMTDENAWHDGFAWMCERLVRYKGLLYGIMSAK